MMAVAFIPTGEGGSEGPGTRPGGGERGLCPGRDLWAAPCAVAKPPWGSVPDLGEASWKRKFSERGARRGSAQTRSVGRVASGAR